MLDPTRKEFTGWKREEAAAAKRTSDVQHRARFLEGRGDDGDDDEEEQSSARNIDVPLMV